MRKTFIAICAAGALLASASYIHAEARVETLDQFMNPHSALIPAGAALFKDYRGYMYARGTGRLRVMGTLATGETDGVCELFEAAHLIETINEIHLSDGTVDICTAAKPLTP